MKIELNEITIEVFQDSKFSLDGGAMFGVVPKVLWHKENPGDEYNRINLAANIMIIRHPEYTALIEQGMGDKWSKSQTEMFNIRRRKSQIEHLKDRNLNQTYITHVILTHLHFDHCGGATWLDENGKVVPTFPNAKYFVQEQQFREAIHPHERNRASYIPDTFMPIRDSGQMELLDGNSKILPGIKVVLTGGHAAGHQVIEMDFEDIKLVYIGDLIPTANHINPAWIMGYDLYPVETLEMKKHLLHRYAKENRLIVFPHESRFFGGYVFYDDEKNRFRLNQF